MLWCPKCKEEYRDGFKKCSDCDVDLVSKLESESEYETTIEYDTETFLLSVGNDIEANVIISKLQAHGIPVMKKHKETGGYLSVFMGASPFGMDLYVPSKSLQNAKEIVSDEGELINEEEQNVLQNDNENEFISFDEDNCQQKRRFRAFIFILLFSPGLVWLAYVLIMWVLSLFNKLSF